MEPVELIDLERIATRSRLLDAAEVTPTVVPLAERGVEVSWLHELLWEVNRCWRDQWKKHDERQSAADWLDHVPDPPRPRGERNPTFTSGFVVHRVIKPLTAALETPLYDLVPEDARGAPDHFVSHAWSNPLIAGPTSTFEAMESPYRGGNHKPSYVWLDIACHNQHRPEAVAADMRELIESIGRVSLPLYNGVPFTRLWCLWELLCAHVSGAAVHCLETAGSAYDIGSARRAFERDFDSVGRAAATFEDDRKAILEALVATFGTYDAADEHFRELADGFLSRESDKPWNRTRSGSDD